MKRPNLNPNPGEVWRHPFTGNSYYIHSVTDDGWVRYYSVRYSMPLFTQPTLEFINKYERD